MINAERPRVAIIDSYNYASYTRSPRPPAGFLSPSIACVITSGEDLSLTSEVVGKQLDNTRVRSLPSGSEKSPLALSRFLQNELQGAGASHVMVLGTIRIPDEVSQSYEGKIIRVYPGALDPKHLDENGNPLDFGNLQGRRPSLASLTYVHTAEGPYATMVSAQHISGEDWKGDLSSKASVTYSWIDRRRAGTLEKLVENKSQLVGDANRIHAEVLRQIPRLIENVLEGLNDSNQFPRFPVSQKLIPDGKEYLLYKSRKLADEFSP